MRTWEPKADTQNRTGNIPATPGETTYNSDPYYIGLKKNGELNTINISDFTITKPDWIKDVSLGNKSSNGNYYQLTYKVGENPEASERVGHISIKHDAANKIIDYYITQSANTTQEPTEPTPNTYSFTTKYHIDNQDDGGSYSLKVNNYSVGESGSFESISSDEIKDGVISDEKPFKINITMSNPYKTGLQSDLKFKFTISCDGLESFDAVINNDDGGGTKTVDIQHSQSNIGELEIESIRPGLVINITIFKGSQMSITDLQLSAGIAGKITINSDEIPFVVTFDFI